MNELLNMKPIGKRQRYLTVSSINQFHDNNDEHCNLNSQLSNKRYGSMTADIASHRFIVSERQQLAVLKQLTANDESNSTSSLSFISQQRPTKIHRRNEHGETIVHIAARKGNLKKLKKALKAGANVNEQDNAGWTPLHEAVTKNQFKAVSLLLKFGANSNAPGPEGQTPLIDAVLNNNTKIVELLLKYSADPSVIDLTRINETMLKILKEEITAIHSSDNENDNESISSSLSMTSINDLEYSNLSRKNSYEYESDNDDEIIQNSKQQIINTSLNDNNIKNEINLNKEYSISNDKHIHHMYRIPPLKIVLVRNVLQKKFDTKSINSLNMDSNLTVETSPLPIIEQNEKFLSTVITSSEVNDKVMTFEQEHEKKDKNSEENFHQSTDKNKSSISNIDYDQTQSCQMIISTIVDNLLSKIDSNINKSLPSSEEQNIIKKKDNQNDLKTSTRTLRSHARGNLNLSISNQILNNNRHISNRKRPLEKKHSFDTNEKIQRKKRISERSNPNETSSNSDDQTAENITRTIKNDDNISDDGKNWNNSTINTKQIHNQSDTNILPPNKRRLRERNIGILNSTDTTTTNSSSTEENFSIETTARDVPINCIKQFLEIRQQINKRHETMLNDYVLPKIPKDFAETLMAKKNYLITPTYKTFSITTPASLGIKRLNPPNDLDLHLSDIFIRQEDERYRMKLRHQVEREKLILSHEQEILRLYGNATRLSINQDIPFSYCSLLKDNEVYSNLLIQERSSSFINNDYTNTELNKRGKHRWNGRSFIKWLEDSNLKYKRLSCEINQRQLLEANTLYSMQRMVWLKHLSKEILLSGRINDFLSEHYLPKVEINTNFWTHWQTNSI